MSIQQTSPSGYVVGIGAANIDLMGRSAKPLVMEDSNPGDIHMSVGGVTHNILANASLLGIKTKLVTTLGDDLYADEVRRHCDKVGIDASDCIVIPGWGSPMYLSLHDNLGEMALAVSDMHLFQQLTVEHLEAKRSVLENANLILIDTCLPETILQYLASTYGERIPIYVDPVSTGYAKRISGPLKGFHTLKPNRLELSSMSGMDAASDPSRACRKLLDRGARRIVVSLGREGSYSLDRLGTAVRVRGEPLDFIANATGAGDAFMGGLLYAAMHGLGPADTLLLSSGVARLALQHTDTINPDITVQGAWDEVEKGRLRAEVLS